MKKKIIIADDHPIVLHGMKQILLSDENLDLIAEAKNGEEAVELTLKLNPDILVLDLDMPKMNGLEAADKVAKSKLNTLIIMMTAYKDEKILNTAFKNGVSGFILKENAIVEILACIDNVVKGKRFISPALTDILLNQNKAFENENPVIGIASLTITEKKILKLVSENKTTKQIAEILFLSPRTVENHRNNICKKLSISGSNSLLRFALENREKL